MMKGKKGKMKKTENGNGDKIQTFATITHLMLALGAVIMACGIAYASLVQRVSSVEEKLPGLERDHDLLITINANIESMRKDMQDLKFKLEEQTKFPGK